ncbi:MAG: trypsin-like peptidase domain-containing protein [Candidatus Rokubacteria bacterium]|nr:trypsin-like peptidase domain-containing protein [Candidatus Rokubacteria bacterium]
MRGVAEAVQGRATSVHATFVHLSGSKRGRRETSNRALIRIGTAPDCALRFSAVEDREVSPHHAQIRFENCAFLLTDLGSAAGTFVNGVQVTEVILQDGDLIEVGQDGPRLRFRVSPEELASCTPFRVILSNSQALARAGSPGRLAGATRFLISLALGVLREASWTVRGVGLVLALLFVAFLVGVPVALYRGQRSTERAVTELATRLQGEQVLRQDLERRVSDSRQLIQASRGELTDLMATLRVERQRQALQLVEIERKLRGLEAQGGASERIIRTYAGGIALLQGAAIFEDPSGRPLRYLAADDKGRPLRDPFGRTPVSVDGTGPVAKTVFSGTGFLVSREGAILTSRHVVEPWREDQELAAILRLGVQPRVVQLRAFFPDLSDPIRVSVLKVSEAADVTLLKGDVEGRSIPVLPLDRTGKDVLPGRPVLVLGYPGGLDLLLARVEPAVLQPLMEEDSVDMVSLLERLARRKLIRPYATWGHLADVRAHEIAYDARTTLGGSGGPVLNLSGRVIGVNYAFRRDFEGASFGVPIRFAVALLPVTPEGRGHRPKPAEEASAWRQTFRAVPETSPTFSGRGADIE